MKTHSQIKLNGEKLKAFLLRSRITQGGSLLRFGYPSHSNQREKKKKIQIGKEAKLSLFADDIILCIENPKDVTRKLLVLINEFDKAAGYKN